MTNTPGRSAVGRIVRRMWALFIDTVEWTSNGDRRRPRFAERTDILDPTAGYGRGEGGTGSLRAERGELPRD